MSLRRAYLCAIALTVGCTSADFGATDPGEDDASADSAAGDSPAPDGGQPDAIGTDSTDAGETSKDGGTCTTTNACGGCAKLTGAAGDKCASCGKLACSADGNSLDCSGDHPKNVCGGCATLAGGVGDPCCGGGTLSCGAGGDALVCSKASNACGGCSVLDHAPGAACEGVCGSAKYACSGGDATTCFDPVPATPTLGSKCGTCGVYTCNPGGTALICVGDSKLGRDIDYDVPSLGVQPYLERTRDTALVYTTAHTGQIVDIQLYLRRTDYVCRTVTTLPHFDPACTSCTKTGANYDCKVPSPTDGTLTLTAYVGTPGGTASALGIVTLAPSTIPTPDGWMTFTFPTPLVSIPAGRQVFFLLHSDSTRWTLVLEGEYTTIAPPPASYASYSKWIYPPAGSTTTYVLGAAAPSFRVDLNGCF